MRFFYYTTVSSALPALARVAKSSPYYVRITAPISKAQHIAERQAERYPSITTDHVTRTALRKAKLPAVQMLIMPPKGDSIDIFLLTNVKPPDSRETWQLCLDPDFPLTWRNYQLCTRTEGPRRGAVTWRLSEQARAFYKDRLARLITGRGGKFRQGEKPKYLSDDTARAQVLKLADHLKNYPGLSEIRADIFQLAQASTKMWKSTRPKSPFPLWPTMPYQRFITPKKAPLDTLTAEYAEAEAQASA